MSKWISKFKQLKEYFSLKRQEYRQSEKYYFQKFRKAAKTGKPKIVLNAIYLWIDSLSLKEPTLNYFSGNFGDETVKNETGLLEGSIKTNKPISINLKSWSLARKRYLNSLDKKGAIKNDFSINP